MPQSTTLVVTHRGKTIDVPIDLAAATDNGDAEQQYAALRHAVRVACDLDSAVECRLRLVGPGGRVIVGKRGPCSAENNAAAALARRQLLPAEVADGSRWMLVCPPAGAADIAAAAAADDEDEGASGAVAAPSPIDGPLSADDVAHLMQCCTAATIPGRALLQPRFEFTLYLETEGEEAPAIPVCGPCATTCLRMEHVHIMDPPGTLERPFSCACCSIIADGHECFWAAERSAGQLSAAERNQLRQEWQREHRAFTDGIVGQLEAAAQEDQRCALKKLTAQLRGSVELFEQYRDEEALAAARRVVPLQALQERAIADINSTAEMDAAANAAHVSSDTSRLHHALLRQLVAWFHEDFFAWMQRPSCPKCDSGRTEPVPKEVKKPEVNSEERQNWAAGVELYECRDCGAEARFPRYQRAKRLLSYRKGRCGEFSICFALCAAALGYEVRTVSSSADRAWNEVYSSFAGRWLHVDASKGLVDSPLNDETSASGKAHPYVFAVSHTEVVDVTLRYTTNALKYLARDKYSEHALSKLVRGFARAGAMRVEKPKLALHERRQRDELTELASAFTAEEAAVALVTAAQNVATALTGGAELPFDSATGADGKPNTTPDPSTVLSMHSRRGLAASVVRDGDEDATAPAPKKWGPFGSAALSLSGPDTHVELVPEGHVRGCLLPLAPKPENVLTPANFFAFDGVFAPHADGAATVCVGIGTAIHLSVHWGAAADDGSPPEMADVLLKFPDLKPLSEHTKLGGHAPVVPGLGELRLHVPATAAATCRDPQQPVRAISLGFTLDALGVLRLAAAPGDATCEGGSESIASATVTAHALVAPHALMEVAGGNTALVSIHGHAVRVTSLNAVSSGT